MAGPMDQSTTGGPRPRLRVLTLNVFGPANPDWERRAPLIAATIKELDPDVVALQEVPVTSEEVLDQLLGGAYHRSHFARPADDGVAGTLAIHAVVLGDFDATPDSASMQFWRGRRSVDGRSVCYQDAWEYAHPDDPGYTFELANPLVRQGEMATSLSRRIDYLLVRSGLHGPTLQVADCRRVLTAPVDGVWASDHYGVLSDLVVPHRAVAG